MNLFVFIRARILFAHLLGVMVGAFGLSSVQGAPYDRYEDRDESETISAKNEAAPRLIIHLATDTHAVQSAENPNTPIFFFNKHEDPPFLQSREDRGAEKLNRLYRELNIQPQQQKLWDDYLKARRDLFRTRHLPVAPPNLNALPPNAEGSGMTRSKSESWNHRVQKMQNVISTYERLYESATPEQQSVLLRYKDRPKKRVGDDFFPNEEGEHHPPLPPPMIPVNR